jgi:hypothetical protein
MVVRRERLLLLASIASMIISWYSVKDGETSDNLRNSSKANRQQETLSALGTKTAGCVKLLLA